MIEMGSKVRDVITGFEGIVTGRCEYITGCSRLLITPRCDDASKQSQGNWFDIDRVEQVDESRLILASRTANGPGLPAPIK